MIHESNMARIAIAIALAAFAFRVVVALEFPETGGDWNLVYSIFSENLYRHGCFSLSDPASGACVPETGGYFPGFPAFVAATWGLVGISSTAVYCLHALLYALTLFHLLNVLARAGVGRKWIIITGTVLAFSPTNIGWFRYMLTEPLSVTMHLWFLAALIDSLHSRKPNILALALSMSAAIYVRPESALLMVPLGLLLLFMRNDAQIRRGLLTALALTAIIASLWPLRNLTLGKPPISMYSTIYPNARGYISWVSLWEISEYDRGAAIYPLFLKEHSRIILLPGPFLSEQEARAAKTLLADASVSDHKDLPTEVDDSFKQLAINKGHEQNWVDIIGLNALRAGMLMLHPYSSFGLPLEVKLQADESLEDAVFRSPAKVLGKLLLFLYRATLILTFLTGVVLTILKLLRSPRQDLHWSEVFMLGCFAYLATKLGFFVAIVGLEARYMTTTYLGMETSLVAWLAFVSAGRQRARMEIQY